MISERTSLRISPNGDVEPWIVNEANSNILSPGTADSFPSRCSIVSEKRSNSVRKCVLFLLTFAVFVIGVLLAFLVGHWVAKSAPNDSSNSLLTPTLLSDATALSSSATPLIAIIANNNSEKVVESKNITLYDIYPPTTTDVTPRAFHFTGASYSITEKHQRAQLLLLPTTVRPVHYDLQLDFTELSLKEKIYGNVSILLEFHENLSNANEITFHSAPNVHIDKLRLHQRGRPVGVQSLVRDQRTRTVRLRLKQPLKKEWYTLEMQFATRICENEKGGVHCYRAAHVRRDGSTQSTNNQTIVSFTTKFEPSLARTFFPCWDEPRWKATFNISVLHLSSTTVLSNAAPYRQKQKQRRSFVRTHFHETPPMSTFLLAFAYGPFIRVEKRTTHNIPLSIYSFSDDLVYTKFAAIFSPNMFDKLYDEFATPYPLSKIDFVVARAFPVGGMENWGLVVFQNEIFLFDSLLEVTPVICDFFTNIQLGTFYNEVLGNANMTVDLLAERYDIEKIITHELAHQWFGNLVTIDDWSELWISEGFASFYANDFLSKEHPIMATNEYYLHLSQLISKQTSGEKMPLVRQMKSEAEIEKAFNPYHLYTKGSVVVKMIRDLIGDYNFREGVRRFLRINAYKSVGRDALWKAMPAYTDHGVSSERLERVIEPWLLNDGMPEVIVSRSYNNGGIRLIQRTSDRNRYVAFLRASSIQRNERGNSKRSRGYSNRHFKKYSHKASQKGHIAIEKSVPARNRSAERRLTRSDWNRPAYSVESKNNEKLFIKHDHMMIKKGRRSQRDKQIWSIPFSYRFGLHVNGRGEHTCEFWLHNESITFTDHELPANVPLLANPNWKYPYRVNYDIENWKMLTRLLHENHLLIPLKSRMQLLLDAEFYLKQSNVPEIYLNIMSYLSKENDVGILLFGLDALYRFIDMFRGSAIKDSILNFARRICEGVDKVMDETKMKTELAALWLIDPTRLIQLYKLRCAVNLSTCDWDDKVHSWITSGGLTEGDHYSQMTAICNYLFTRATKVEYDLVENGLKQFTDKWTVLIQLSTCVRDEGLLRKVVKRIIATKNAAIYTAILQNEFTLHHNAKFRELFWSEIAKMPLLERKLLFSVSSEHSIQVAQILVHSVRSSAEFQHLTAILPTWNSFIRLHLEYLRRQFQWMDEVALPRIQHFFSKNFGHKVRFD